MNSDTVLNKIRYFSTSFSCGRRKKWQFRLISLVSTQDE